MQILTAQTFIGAGNNNGITITASDEYQESNWTSQAVADNLMDASGMDDERFRFGRFLQQATIGFEQSHIDDVASMGIEAWIDDQLSKPISKLLPEVNNYLITINNARTQAGEEPRTRPNANQFQYAWWQTNMTNEDLLRHKVAAALSEILVISRNSDLRGFGDALASFYDVLLTHAFGNYRDLMYDVTLHPAMGFYLSHVNNPKSDPSIGRFPDENYARELMQLFSIGLYELNLNGTRKQAGGEDIPTYDNDDIIEYSKIFTGLSYGALLPGASGTLRFGMNKGNADMTIPMIMYDVDDPSTNQDEDQHEEGSKQLLLNTLVPAGQTGIEDINDAIDNLFNHPNVGPFLSYRLIQRMVKPNPSPQYVRRMSLVFNNDGNGVRGNLGALVKAILRDQEARDCSYQANDNNSRLKEPVFRYTQFARAVDKDLPANTPWWNNGESFRSNAGQAILSAPSVFNFFLPIDGPNGVIENRGLVAPEFKLHDTRYSVGYFNQVRLWTQNQILFRNYETGLQQDISWEIATLENIAKDTEHYINWIDRNITHGRMSDKTRAIIRNALAHFYTGRTNYLRDRVRMGMYLALISPDYTITE